MSNDVMAKNNNWLSAKHTHTPLVHFAVIDLHHLVTCAH